MQNNNLLQSLTEFEPAGFPFISIYLNTEPNENGKTNFDVFLRKQINEQRENYEIRSSERESYDQDAERINAYLENLAPSTRGAAIFACYGANEFFETIEFDVPFKENQFFVFDRPHLFPLVHLIKQNPTYAVVLADTNAAHIYLFGAGQILEKEDIENTKTNRSQVGGWSQMRYQRHLENFHQQHAKEIIEELGKIVRDEQIKQVVLAGDETVIIPLLRGEMPKELDEKVVEILRLNIDTPEHEILEASQKAVFQHHTLQDQEKVDHLFEENYDGGLGVTGVERTLTALSNGQVQELYLSADFNLIKYNKNKVEQVLENYAPGEETEQPSVRETEMIVDELIRKGLNSADEIRFIEDENLLEKAGGVGALLRYKMNTSTAQQ
jgi:peptide chain release factor subunit 1